MKRKKRCFLVRKNTVFLACRAEGNYEKEKSLAWSHYVSHTKQKKKGWDHLPDTYKPQFTMYIASYYVCTCLAFINISLCLWTRDLWKGTPQCDLVISS